MASWQPPIPSGALYSHPARQLGSGLALLAYCYDKVQRDGSLELNLHTAAADMEEPYPNVKRWWHAIKTSGILTDIQERGRNGIRAKFDEEWLDWRILSTRKNNEHSGNKQDINETENDPDKPETGHKRDINEKNTRPKMIPNENVYKEDHESDNRLREPSAAPSHESPHQAIMQAYGKTLGYPIRDGAKEGNAAKWLVKNGYTADQVVACYQHFKADSFWAGQHLSLQSIAKQIGAFVQAQKQGNLNGNGTGKPYVSATAESERKQQEARFALYQKPEQERKQTVSRAEAAAYAKKVGRPWDKKPE